MNCTRSVSAVFLVTIALLSAGCGTTGTTKRIILNNKARGDVMTARELNLRSMRVETGATKLLAIAVVPWGELSPQDVKTLESSLRDNLRLSQHSGDLKSPPLVIDVRIRRHLVATSNNGAAVLACVAWRAQLDNATIYEEQFYASAAGYMVRTVGSVKNDVNKAVLSRIVRSAIYLANNSAATPELPVQVKNTYLAFDDSLKKLPKAMTSSPPPGFVYVPGNPSSRVPWSWAEPEDTVIWE